MSNPDCLFCKIVAGEIDTEVVCQDDHVLAFRDINPQAPTHVLLIPRKHLVNLAHAQAEDQGLLGHLLLMGNKVAQQEGIVERGFRAVFNINKDGGQSIDHLHLHILGGRPMGWPPG